MGKIVLLAVAAAWAAVLLPPLLRSRIDNRPGSSVTDFRRQLSTLQRTVPTRNLTPMRSMARPLAPSPLHRPAVQLRSAQPTRSHGLTRAHHSMSLVADRPGDRTGGSERQHHTGELARRVPRDHGIRDHGMREQHGHALAHVPARQISRREVIRRRRMNVLTALVLADALALFLAATTKADAILYAFALVFVSLCGYVYKLAQLRQYEQDVRTGEASWFHAA